MFENWGQKSWHYWINNGNDLKLLFYNILPKYWQNLENIFKWKIAKRDCIGIKIVIFHWFLSNSKPTDSVGSHPSARPSTGLITYNLFQARHWIPENACWRSWTEYILLFIRLASRWRVPAFIQDFSVEEILQMFGDLISAGLNKIFLLTNGLKFRIIFQRY